MAFPEAKLKALEEKISHPRWVVPVLPEQELEALLIAATDLAAKGNNKLTWINSVNKVTKYLIRMFSLVPIKIHL